MSTADPFLPVSGPDAHDDHDIAGADPAGAAPDPDNEPDVFPAEPTADDGASDDGIPTADRAHFRTPTGDTVDPAER
jgi:hypothetical protein